MATDDKGVAYARECVRLAGLAKEPQVRDHLLSMAGEWMTSDEQESTEGASARSQ